MVVYTTSLGLLERATRMQIVPGGIPDTPLSRPLINLSMITATPWRKCVYATASKYREYFPLMLHSKFRIKEFLKDFAL